MVFASSCSLFINGLIGGYSAYLLISTFSGVPVGARVRPMALFGSLYFFDLLAVLIGFFGSGICVAFYLEKRNGGGSEPERVVACLLILATFLSGFLPRIAVAMIGDIYITQRGILLD